MSSKLESFLNALDKIEKRTFILPTINQEITYRKLDILEGSIDGSMPNFISSKVLEVMKKGLAGVEVSEVPVTEPSNEDVKDLLIKATQVLEKAIIEPKLSMDQIVRIPSDDRIAWFMEAVAEAYNSKTTSGSEVSVSEVASFPEKRSTSRNSKRSSDSEVL